MKELDENKNPIPFNISVRKFEKKSKVGGELRVFRGATLMQPPKNKGLQRLNDSTPFKNPNHFINRTRNIKTEFGEKKINILFIIEFNGKKVVY